MRYLVYNAVKAKEEAKNTGERHILYCSTAKLFASETAMFCAHAAVQIHGGMGYSKKFPVNGPSEMPKSRNYLKVLAKFYVL